MEYSDALLLIEPDEDALFQSRANEADALLAKITAVVPTSPGEAASLSEARMQGRAVRNALEELRKKIVKPLNEQVSAINGMFKPWVNRLDEFYARCELLLLAWQKTEDEAARRRAEEAKKESERIERERAEADAKQKAALTPEEEEEAKAELTRVDFAVAMVQADIDTQPVHGIKTASGTSHERKEWQVTVDDWSKVPREHLVVDEAKTVARLRRLAADHERLKKPPLKVDGCTIVLVKRMAGRTR